MSAHEISEGLELHSIKTHEWHIQAACALTGLCNTPYISIVIL